MLMASGEYYKMVDLVTCGNPSAIVFEGFLTTNLHGGHRQLLRELGLPVEGAELLSLALYHVLLTFKKEKKVKKLVPEGEEEAEEVVCRKRRYRLGSVDVLIAGTDAVIVLSRINRDPRLEDVWLALEGDVLAEDFGVKRVFVLKARCKIEGFKSFLEGLGYRTYRKDRRFYVREIRKKGEMS